MTVGTEDSWRVRAEVQIGEGTYGRVYKATRVNHIVALKKSRASRTLKTTLLNHERLLLQRLQEHPSIPNVLAYGRLDHFEYLAMEFLGTALDDVHRRRPSLPAVNVLVVADQMISALEHIHKNGLVHCDLKPGNIILHPTDPMRLYIIDYGLARVISHTAETSSMDVPSDHLVGTLPYASLNMHYGIRPAPRDDVESLGYSLLSLARGNLPWTYNVYHGTKKTQYDQVRLKKQQYSGADLTLDGLPCIGQIIGYARSLKFDQLPDYELLRTQVRETRARAGLLASSAVEWDIPAEVLSDDASPCPVPNESSLPLHPGQIVCCQVDVRTTLEGYSARAGDPSFWRDPSLSPDKWNTAVRPAVILRVERDNRTMLWTVHVVCIGRGALSLADANAVPISSSHTECSVATSPAWPLSDSYCYIFPRPMKFHCYPGEVRPVASPWTLSTVDIDLLLRRFGNDTFAKTLSGSEKQYYNEEIFVKVTAFGLDLQHEDGEGQPIQWGGQRAWFDEQADLIRLRDVHQWGTPEQGPSGGGAPSDSYWDWDFERWGHCQGELGSSVAAGVDEAGSPGMPPLPVIVDVEMSDDVRYQASLT